MTVQELIYELQLLDPNSEVRIAHQPNYPFELSIDQVVEYVEGEDQDEPSNLTAMKIARGELTSVVYLAEGSQIGYLPGEAKDALGW